MRKIVIVLFLAVVAFSGCKNDESEFVATNIEYTECLVRPKNLKTNIVLHDNTLSISHDYLPVNCNYQGVLVSPTIDDENRIIEIDVDPIVIQADLEDCECCINVSYQFENFYKKNALYTIIIRENNQEIYRGEEAL